MLGSRLGPPLQAPAAQAEHAFSLLGYSAGPYTVCAQGRGEVRLRKTSARAKSSGGDRPRYHQGKQYIVFAVAFSTLYIIAEITTKQVVLGPAAEPSHFC